jgi:hypothetical protein
MWFGILNLFCEVAVQTLAPRQEVVVQWQPFLFQSPKTLT